MSIHASIAESMSPALESVFGYENPARRVLSKFGTDAHVWIPGIGYFNGLQAGNYIDSAGTQAGLVDNPVGRVNDAVGAITATQGTTANKPLLRRGAVNLLTYSEQFDNAVWVKDQSSIDANTASAPNSTQTADYIKEDGTTNVHQVRGNFTVISGATYNFSVYIKAGNRTWASFSFSNPTASVFFNLTNGAIGTTTGSVSGSVISVGNGWYRCSATVTATATTLTVRIQAATSDNTNFYLGDGTSGIYIWGAQLELGSTASGYIPTTTAAASSSSGNYYWQFDGSNDSLALSSVPFQMADDFAIVIGMRGLPLLPTDAFCVASTSNANALIKLGLSATAVAQFRCQDDAGTADNMLSVSTYTQALVVLAGKKNGNAKTLRVNGVATSSSSTALGTTTLTNAGIGYRPLATPINYMTGSMYPVIAIKGTVSDADLLILERWVGQMSGVSI